MSGGPSRSEIDRAVDADDDGIASRLADLLDLYGWWDWSDGSEHAPSDRLAVVESSGAWWCVYRGTEADDAHRFGTEEEAKAYLAGQADA